AWWAGQQYALHPEILDRIRHQLDATVSQSQRIVADAWHAILEYHDLRSNGRDSIYDLRSPGQEPWSGPQIRHYLKQFSPHLKLRANWRSSVPPARTSTLRVSDLVSLEIDYREDVLTVHVPDECLRAVISKLRICLEL